MVEQWVKDFVDEFDQKEEIIDGKNYFYVKEPIPGQILYFKPFMDSMQYKIGDFYKVKIKKGQYWGSHGLSNFWYWERIDENNIAISEENGYGNFFISEEVNYVE
jgi:hypothetical protein